MKSDRKSTRLNSSHLVISYAVFCLKKKNNTLAHCISIQPQLASRRTHTRSRRAMQPLVSNVPASYLLSCLFFYLFFFFFFIIRRPPPPPLFPPPPPLFP